MARKGKQAGKGKVKLEEGDVGRIFAVLSAIGTFHIRYPDLLEGANSTVTQLQNADGSANKYVGVEACMAWTATMVSALSEAMGLEEDVVTAMVRAQGGSLDFGGDEEQAELLFTSDQEERLNESRLNTTGTGTKVCCPGFGLVLPSRLTPESLCTKGLK